jgi:hypothetical protein
MSEEPNLPDFVVRLDTENRRQIDVIKTRMEDFLKNQIELKHSVDIVSDKQDVLKERFEIGTAGTLRNLNEKFDAFRVEWGEKKAEDKNRDKAIQVAQSTADEAKDNFRKYLLWPIITLCFSILFAVIGWVAKHG